MADDGDDDYRVGYGSPPKHTRFQTGRSGNPKGRPKGAKAKTPEEIFRQALEQPMRVKKPNGVICKKPALEVVINRVVQEAANGKIGSQKLLLDKLDKNGLLKTPPPQQQVGAVVLREPARSTEEWLARADEYKLPLNPLEGLPGIDPETFNAKALRGTTPQDDDD